MGENRPEKGDFVSQIAAMSEEQLCGYISDRLSTKEPFRPPLREPEESPRHFIENLMLFARKADQAFLGRIERCIHEILSSFLCADLVKEIKSGNPEALALLSHSLYLAGTFHLESCAPVVWGLYVSEACSSKRGPLGPLNTLLGDAAGALSDSVPLKMGVLWQSVFQDDDQSLPERIQAFNNLYRTDPVRASDAAKELLQLWRDDVITEPFRVSGIVTRYLWQLTKTQEATESFESTSLIKDLLDFAYFQLPAQKSQELFEEMRKFPQLSEYVPFQMPTTLVSVCPNDSQANDILSDLASKRNWSLCPVKSELSGDTFSSIGSGMVICVVDYPLPDTGSLWIKWVPLLYKFINDPQIFVIFVLNEELWVSLEEFVGQLRVHPLHVPTVTSVETSRITSFSSPKSLSNKVNECVDYGVKLAEYLQGSNRVADQTFQTITSAAFWRGSVLYDWVSQLFDPLEQPSKPYFHIDSFRATVHSVCRQHNDISYEPGTGLFGISLQEVSIRSSSLPFRLEGSLVP